jgi:hypothetical protein
MGADYRVNRRQSIHPILLGQAEQEQLEVENLIDVFGFHTPLKGTQLNSPWRG